MNLSTPALTTLLARLNWYHLGSRTRVWMLVGAALGLLVTLLVCWALYFRKRRRRHSRHHHHHHQRTASGSPHGDSAAPAAGQEGERRRVKRSRRRRQDEGRRNPTRAETGGLPGRSGSDVVAS
jgi:ABC-type nickel/cobalt efflux system permease component RcnA